MSRNDKAIRFTLDPSDPDFNIPAKTRKELAVAQEKDLAVGQVKQMTMTLSRLLGSDSALAQEAKKFEKQFIAMAK